MPFNCGAGEPSCESWTARRSNQSILKAINPEYSLDAEAEAPILLPSDAMSRLIGKDPDVGNN